MPKARKSPIQRKRDRASTRDEFVRAGAEYDSGPFRAASAEARYQLYFAYAVGAIEANDSGSLAVAFSELLAVLRPHAGGMPDETLRKLLGVKLTYIVERRRGSDVGGDELLDRVRSLAKKAQTFLDSLPADTQPRQPKQPHDPEGLSSGDYEVPLALALAFRPRWYRLSAASALEVDLQGRIGVGSNRDMEEAREFLEMLNPPQVGRPRRADMTREKWDQEYAIALADVKRLDLTPTDKTLATIMGLPEGTFTGYKRRYKS